MDIEEIKRKRIEEYLSDLGREQEQQASIMKSQQLQQLQESIIMLENIAKKIMTKEAISRYGNLKLAHPETALKAIWAMSQIVESGYKEKITDSKFKEILIEIKKQEKQKKY